MIRYCTDSVRTPFKHEIIQELNLKITDQQELSSICWVLTFLSSEASNTEFSKYNDDTSDNNMCAIDKWDGTWKWTSDGAQLANMVESLIIPSTKRISMIQLLHRHLIKHVMLLMSNLGTTFMATRANLPMHHLHIGPYGPYAANTVCPDGIL